MSEKRRIREAAVWGASGGSRPPRTPPRQPLRGYGVFPCGPPPAYPYVVTIFCERTLICLVRVSFGYKSRQKSPNGDEPFVFYFWFCIDGRRIKISIVRSTFSLTRFFFRRRKIFEKLDRGDAIDFVKKSSKSELSSRFFGRLKISEDLGQGSIFFSKKLRFGGAMIF